MREQFSIEYKNQIFNFELNKKDGMVWLIQNDEINSKSNHGQVLPAKDIAEAKEIAAQMLYTMGY